MDDEDDFGEEPWIEDEYCEICGEPLEECVCEDKHKENRGYN